MYVTSSWYTVHRITFSKSAFYVNFLIAKFQKLMTTASIGLTSSIYKKEVCLNGYLVLLAHGSYTELLLLLKHIGENGAPRLGQ